MQSKILIPITIILSIFFSSCSSGERDNPIDPQGNNFNLGFNISEISGNTSELGDMATFTVKLSYQPTTDVVIPISSSNTNEGIITHESLTFTPLNWNANQVVTVTGVDDNLVDGYVEYSIILAPAISGDANYNGLDPADVSLTNTDNETAGFTIGGITGNTGENLTTATFTVKLNSRPDADVIIPISSNDNSEGTASPASITFTPENWNARQVITVTGVNDYDVDGDQEYLIVLEAVSSADPEYNGLDPDDVTVLNIDNNSPGFEVTLLSTNTGEDGSQAQFIVRLYSQPSAEVTIPISSGNPSEGSVSPDNLTFTPFNWNANQLVTVTGQDDNIADGNQDFIIILGTASSSDSGYNDMDPEDVNLVNIDNDSPGFTISAISGNTTEIGGQATFTVNLNSEPTASVYIPVESSDPTEGGLSTALIIFTTVNWNANQTITVTGVNDDLADGNQNYYINLNAVSSDDSDYNGLNPDDVSVTNTDNETAGFTISDISGPTTEGRTTATFTVKLNSQPTADVTITVSSSDLGEGTVFPASLVFTNSNWNAAQTVTVTGVDDDLADGNQPYTIVLGPDTTTGDSTGYNGRDPADVSVTNTDDESAGFTISNISGDTTEGKTTATFTVKLNSQPTADVTIAVSSSDISEGTVTPTSLAFTNSNWNAAQTVTVTGVDDDLADGDQDYTIILSPDTTTDDSTGYNGRDPADVSVINTDDETAGFTISDISGDTTESKTTAAFTVKLNSQPTADVTIAVSSSDLGEGTVTPINLIFTDTNWNATQTVTVTGVDDDLADGDQDYTIVLGPDTATGDSTGYNGRDPADVSVTNTDDETAGFTISDISDDTTEGRTTATFTVKLNSQPDANVTIAVSSSDLGEGTVTPINLIFTDTNWNATQTVTVTGVDDDLADGDQDYTIVLGPDTATGDSTGYNGRDPADVSVINTDDETAGFTISDISDDTTEGETTATFTVRLNSQPDADVTIAVSSSDLGEGTVLPVSLVFTDSDWYIDQTVTVTGVDDDLADGDQDYTIVLDLDTTSDTTGYTTIDPSDVSVTNTDDETAGFTISDISGDTDENGALAEFTVRLNSKPDADVTIPVSSNNTEEGTIDITELIFTSLDWYIDQTVTVTGKNDYIADGDQEYYIILGTTESASLPYNNFNPSDVLVLNKDNDNPGFIVSGIGNTTEGEGQATFTITLATEPTDDVTINIVSNNPEEGTVSPTSIILNSTNWNLNDDNIITVTGVDDDIDDDDVTYTISLAAESADSNYDGLPIGDVLVTNIDNDSAGFTISNISGLTTTEDGGTVSFFVNLTSKPTAGVTIYVASSKPDEGTVSPSITLDSTNWNVNDATTIVTVTGVDDDFIDDDVEYTITFVAESADTNYDGFPIDDISMTNIDNDSAGLFISPISGPTTEDGGTASFYVNLTSKPTNDVTINIASSNEDEGIVSTSSIITLDSTNWNVNDATTIVTVTGKDDFDPDGNVEYTITLAAESSDTNYATLPAYDVSVINIDNDTPNFIVSAISGNTSEDGTTATFTVRLIKAPNGTVLITVKSNKTAEGTVNKSYLTFDDTNWNTDKIVEVTGVDDSLIDGNQSYTIVLAPDMDDQTTTATDYYGLDPDDVSVTNEDNDLP